MLVKNTTIWTGILVPGSPSMLMYLFMGMRVAQHVVQTYLCWVAWPIVVASLSCDNQTVWHLNSSDMHLWSETKIIYKSIESNTTLQYSKWNAAGQFDQLQNKAWSCKTLSKLRVGKCFGSMLGYFFLRQVDKLLAPRKHAFPHPGWNIMNVTIKWPLH